MNMPDCIENKLVQCPHCHGMLFIEKINCGVFRHAMYKDGRQFPPHASENECINAVNNGTVFGCGKAFRIIDNVIHICYG